MLQEAAEQQLAIVRAETGAAAEALPADPIEVDDGDGAVGGQVGASKAEGGTSGGGEDPTERSGRFELSPVAGQAVKVIDTLKTGPPSLLAVVVW